MAQINIFNPPQLGKPLGQYSQITRVKATELIFIAGQVGGRTDGSIPDTFEAQCELAFANTLTALQACGAGWGNVVQFTTYLVNSRDIPKLRKFRAVHFPKFFPDGQYPPNTLLVVNRLAGEDMLIEIAAIAALA